MGDKWVEVQLVLLCNLFSKLEKNVITIVRCLLILHENKKPVYLLNKKPGYLRGEQILFKLPKVYQCIILEFCHFAPWFFCARIVSFYFSNSSNVFTQLDILKTKFFVFKNKASCSQYFTFVLSTSFYFIFLKSDDSSYFIACQKGNI